MTETTGTTGEIRLTMEELVAILTECAGDLELPDTPEEIPDCSFEKLGCDSLALLETAARLQSRHGVSVQDDVLAELGSPRALLEHIQGMEGAQRVTV
ncbi:acyl carrier protein [Streptomyces sp. NPDC048442]|uniref:acyl carrier protein n=1 Tax=Streptomyces sp. NPDC048442 TaxID=3154823 RepID=UPI0034277D6E